MENLTLEELVLLRLGMTSLWWDTPDGNQPEKDAIEAMAAKINQAIADREFEEKAKPLNF